jgi:hypothetical protein
MRLSYISLLMLSASLALATCSQKKEPPPDRIDPSELAATREKLSRIRGEVRAAAERAGEISRKARGEDAGPEPAPAD